MILRMHNLPTCFEMNNRYGRRICQPFLTLQIFILFIVLPSRGKYARPMKMPCLACRLVLLCKRQLFQIATLAL